MSTAETRNNKKKKKNDVGRKRFTDKQISFLEYMFETQSRPELRMKHQLANKLGLHPRQVAIWFQNKRARSKSRQIEQEYNTLKHNYDTLASKSDFLKRENQALHNQLQTLRNLAERHQQHKPNGNTASEESDAQNDAQLVSETSLPFYDSIAYFEEEPKFLEIEQQLESCRDWEVADWWEF